MKELILSPIKPNLKFNKRINVTQPKLPKLEKYLDYIKEIWNNHWLTNDGPLHEEFKTRLRKFLNAKNVELFTNGHLALEIAIKSLNLKGEVITTPFTFASTVHAIVNNGLTPIFCDIEKKTYNIDAEQIESLINERTSAIIAVHVFGNPCDVYKIEEIAKKYDLKVIYDAAHAFGVKINGESIAGFGDFSMFSFHATKVFHSIEGGLLVFKDESLKNLLKSLKNFGITSAETVDYVGINAKMNEFQAAMGLCNLQEIEDDIAKRERIYKAYVSGLKNIHNIRYLEELPLVKHNYSYFPILFESEMIRDYMHKKLMEYNVFTRKYFYPLVNSFGCYAFDPERTPHALDVSRRILALPMYTELPVSDAQQICEIIRYELEALM
jgi:dTDP-4-amino-4,6-dideoxygalactose transaminase